MLATLAQTTADDSASGGAAIALLGAYVVVIVIMCVAYWRVFTKMGLPGWMGIIPFVNVYMIFKARGERSPVLWLILFFIPCINIIAAWFLASDTAEIFGKGIGWKLFLFFIPGIAHLVLAFSDDQAVPSNMAPGVGINAGRPAF